MQCICASNAVFIQKVFSIYYSTTLLLSKFSMFWTRAQERQLRKHPRGQFAVYELGSIFSSNCITPKQTKGFNLAGWVNTFWQNARFGRNFTTSQYGQCSSWIQMFSPNQGTKNHVRGKEIIKMVKFPPMGCMLDSRYLTCGQASEMWTPLASVDSHSV